MDLEVVDKYQQPTAVTDIPLEMLFVKLKIDFADIIELGRGV